MLGRSFKIVAPKRLDLFIEDVECNNGEAIVKIEKASICKADIRYYLGQRDKRLLGLKYPMNLLHEAVGIVLNDPTSTFKSGDRVVLVPNLTLNCEKSQCKYKVCQNKKLGENYCPDASFASSNFNGFSREFLSYPVSNLVYVPEELTSNIAVFSELISVAHAMIRRIEIEEDDTIGIWGDGILGYILACTLKATKKVKVVCIGKNEEKLYRFPVEQYFLRGSEELKNVKIDIAFECVGGKGVQSAVEEILHNILPGGKIVLAGVPDDDIEVNTRIILEKGLEIMGVTRSNIKDFESSILTLKDENFKNRISNLVLEEYEVKNINDFYDAFEFEASNKKLGKRVISFIL